MKRSVCLAVAGLLAAGGLALGAGPAGALEGDQGTGLGVETALITRDTPSPGLQTAFTTLTLSTLPPSPIHPTDPYFPGFGLLTAQTYREPPPVGDTG